MVLGLILGYPRLLPYVETMLYTRHIPTAPPLVITPTVTSEPVALMPAEAVASPDATVTPTPTSPSTSDEAPLGTPTPDVTPSATPSPWPSATPTAVALGTVPIRVKVPSIDLDAPVEPIGWKLERIGRQEQAIWDVPDYRAAGWHRTSAPLGLPGNTVLNGHNTQNGEVFRYLYRVEVGAQIFVEGEDGEIYAFKVQEKYILREAGQPLAVRLENARYIESTPDARLTLVTCHPYGSLANRLVLIAHPETNQHVENGAS
jgi:sortase A